MQRRKREKERGRAQSPPPNFNTSPPSFSYSPPLKIGAPHYSQRWERGRRETDSAEEEEEEQALCLLQRALLNTNSISPTTCVRAAQLQASFLPSFLLAGSLGRSPPSLAHFTHSNVLPGSHSRQTRPPPTSILCAERTCMQTREKFEEEGSGPTSRRRRAAQPSAHPTPLGGGTSGIKLKQKRWSHARGRERPFPPPCY